MAKSHERLDRAMQARIDELDMTWADLVAAMGGHPAVETLRAIRAGRNRPSGRTQRRIEDALGWDRGSIERVLAGGEPTVSDRLPPRTDDVLAELGDQVQQLMETINRLRRENPDSGS